jgi:predicted ATPase/transcriptional regulator with XRE-family HTH domain
MVSSKMATTEEELPLFFGEWLKRRHRALGLTQVELAKRISCSVFTLQKIEAGERRPSKQLAQLLAQALGIPASDRASFIQVARGELGLERLPPLAHPASRHSPPAPKASSLPGNLPRALTPFIGREPELAALGQLLCDPQCSLLTIVGAGGIGKTRLAIEAACQSKDLFPDGVWLVPLVSLNSPDLIVPAIANALDFKFQDPTNPQAQLLRYLRAKRALLVLDNAEHLLEGVGVLTEILKDCPQVKLLVTSRERLSVLSEWVFEIQGLPVPASDQVEQFDGYSSVALFMQSARRVSADFELGEEQRREVRKICQIMEGMPLGIELSAAWVGLLTCEEIASEIEHNLDFLSVSLRDLPERHRSLRATLDHSWKLLNDEERLVLSRLSVFLGRFNREAAQEICGASLPILSSLRNKSLLERTDREDYALHEIIRQYAGLRLAENPDENERVKDRHAVYFIQCLSNWEKALQGSRQLEILNEMARNIDNLSQGWKRMIITCCSRTGKRRPFCAELLHSALFSLSLFYENRCRSLEAIALFQESVDCMKAIDAEFEGTEDSAQFTSVLGDITAYLGLHYYYISQHEKSREYLLEAIQLLDKSQSRVEKAHAQDALASIDAFHGKFQEAADLIQPCREVFREQGMAWWYVSSTAHLAYCYLGLGKLKESEELFQEGLKLVEPGNLHTELQLRSSYAYLLMLKKDLARAEQLLQDSLPLSYQFGNIRLTADLLVYLGRIYLAQQRVDLAEEHIQKSTNLLIEIGETQELAVQRIYLGRCFAARSDLRSAREQFWLAIQQGQELDQIHLVHSGLVDLARTYLVEGKSEKALAISLALIHCPIEYPAYQERNVELLADLQAELPKEQVEAVMKQIDLKISQDPAKTAPLAYALELAAE